MLQSHDTVNGSLRAMLHLCPLTPTHTAEDLGITLEQLDSMLSHARSSSYHTKPPPCESKSKDAKKPPPRFGYRAGDFPYCFTTGSQLLKAVKKGGGAIASSSGSTDHSAATSPSSGNNPFSDMVHDFAPKVGIHTSSSSSSKAPVIISAAAAGSVFAAADGSTEAGALVVDAPPICANHCSIFFELYAAQGTKCSPRVLDDLSDFCTRNPQEWVLKAQLTAQHLFLHLLHLRSIHGQGSSGGLRHPVDYKALPRSVVEGILVSSAVVNQSLVDEDMQGGVSGVTDASSSGKRVMACLDAVQSFTQLLSSLPVLTKGAPPAFSTSNTHFTFLVDTAANVDDEMGQPKDRYFSAQVRLTNLNGKDNHAHFGTQASSMGGDQLLSVKLSQFQVRVDGVVVEDEKGPISKASSSKADTTTNTTTGVSEADRDGMAVGMDCCIPDVQLFLEKETIKKGESGRLLISLIAKPEATFRTCEILAILTVDGVSTVVVTFVVVNPTQPQFASLPPGCLYQHIQESRIGTYEIPLILQILRQSFQVKQGFAWGEVSRLLSVNLKQFSHSNGQLLSRVLFLQDALDDVATGSSLIPLLWSDAATGSILAPNYAAVTGGSSGVNGSGSGGGGLVTPAMRTLVPLGSSHPIGYTPGSLFPVNTHSTSTQLPHLSIEKVLRLSSNGGDDDSGSGYLRTYSRMLEGGGTADEYEDASAISRKAATTSSQQTDPSTILVTPEDTLGLIMLFIAQFPLPLVDSDIIGCDPAAYLESAQPCVQGILLFVIDFCCCLLMYSSDNHTTVRTLALAFAPLLIRSPFSESQSTRAAASSPLRAPHMRSQSMGTYRRNQETYINEQNSHMGHMGALPSLDGGGGGEAEAVASRQRLPQPEELANFVLLETHVVTALIHWIKRYQKLYTSAH